MRFLSSSALASAPKLRLAASCSAAETIELLLPRPARQSPGPESPGRARLADLQIGAARGLCKSRAAPLFLPRRLLGRGGSLRLALVLALRLGVAFFARRRQDLDRTARLLNGLDGRLRRAPDRELRLRLELAGAEHLHAVLGAAHQAGLHHRLHVDRGLDVELPSVDRGLQLAEIDLVEFHRERRVAKAALRQAAVQRHLAAFEALDAHAGTRGLALAAATAGLAHAGADAAANAHALLARAGIVGDLVEFHCSSPSNLFAVMAGFVPAISIRQAPQCRPYRGRRDEPGDDR